MALGTEQPFQYVSVQLSSSTTPTRFEQAGYGFVFLGYSGLDPSGSETGFSSQYASGAMLLFPDDQKSEAIRLWPGMTVDYGRQVLAWYAYNPFCASCIARFIFFRTSGARIEAPQRVLHVGNAIVSGTALDPGANAILAEMTMGTSGNFDVNFTVALDKAPSANPVIFAEHRRAGATIATVGLFVNTMHASESVLSVPMGTADSWRIRVPAADVAGANWYASISARRQNHDLVF